ncbi:MAG TPA: response regulator transcription factor [Candidatus Gemmiger stercorigallinarum]|nr:response regulator transcription factor [Candidatus Gemmiger stercorigallinarum]
MSGLRCPHHAARLGRRLHSATAAPAPPRCIRRRRRSAPQPFNKILRQIAHSEHSSSHTICRKIFLSVSPSSAHVRRRRRILYFFRQSARPPPSAGRRALFLHPCSRDRPSLQDRKAAERRALPAVRPGYGIIAEKAAPRPDAQRPAVLARTGPAAAPQRPDTCPKEGPALPDLLLLEDDAALADGLQYSLARSGFAVTPARTLAQARACLAAGRFDLLILDVTLPDGTGFALCEELRRRGSRVPILFLTASDEEVSVIRGLDSGGDDYLTKPFRLGELCSRIRALLRRAGQQAAGPGLLRCGELTIDLYGSRALLRGQPLELTAAEYRLLCLLVRNAGLTVTREAILDELWDGAGSFVDGNTLSVYVRRLREKVEDDPSRPRHLVTVRGFGYQWKEDAP